MFKNILFYWLIENPLVWVFFFEKVLQNVFCVNFWHARIIDHPKQCCRSLSVESVINGQSGYEHWSLSLIFYQRLEKISERSGSGYILFVAPPPAPRGVSWRSKKWIGRMVKIPLRTIVVDLDPHGSTVHWLWLALSGYRWAKMTQRKEKVKKFNIYCLKLDVLFWGLEASPSIMEHRDKYIAT